MYCVHRVSSSSLVSLNRCHNDNGVACVYNRRSVVAIRRRQRRRGGSVKECVVCSRDWSASRNRSMRQTNDSRSLIDEVAGKVLQVVVDNNNNDWRRRRSHGSNSRRDHGYGMDRRRMLLLSTASSLLVFSDGKIMNNNNNNASDDDNINIRAALAFEKSLKNDISIAPGAGQMIMNNNNQQLRVALSEKSIINAREELRNVVSILESSVRVGTEPDWNKLNRVMEGGNLKPLRKSISDVDAVVGSRPLAAWEKEAWRGMDSSQEMDGGAIDDSSRSLLPFVSRPNAFLCAIFSCQNSPQQPAGTDTLLVVDMLRQGINLGQRGDPRATAEGVLLTAGDALDKMDDYILYIKDLNR